MAATVINQPSELVRGNPHMGYARVTSANTQIMAAVTGPQESRFQKKAKHDRGVLEIFYYDSNSGLNRALHAAELKSLLESVIALEDIPNLMLTVTVLVMNSNGSELSEAINAVYSALLHAGIRLKTHIFAMTFAVKQDGMLIENPTSEDEEACGELITIGVVPGTDQVLLSKCSDVASFTVYSECVTRAKNHSAALQAS